MVCGLTKQRSIVGVVGVVGVVGAVSTDGRCRMRYSLMESLRLGIGAGSGTVSMGFRRGSWLAVRVYSLRGVEVGGGMLSIALLLLEAATAAAAGTGTTAVGIATAGAAVTAAAAATDETAAAAFDLVASKNSAKLGMLLLL